MMRYRSLFLFGFFILAAGFSFWTDPAGGKATMLGGLAIIQGVWAIAAAHLTRKALLDYDEADQKTLFAIAKESPTGSGLALIAVAIVFVGLLMVFAPRASAGEMPSGYFQHGNTLYSEQQKHWPEHPRPTLLASLVEQESCISLKSKRCWNPSAQLKNAREEGAGMGQITRAYRADGSLRFDSLTGLSKQYSNELGSLTWGNVYSRPDLQLRALVLMSRDSARQFKDSPDFLAFGDAGYNGGAGGVKKERRACAITDGCDPQKWFGNVENVCLKSKTPIYGNRSACDINREHVRYVMLIRVKKYEV